MSVTSRTVVEGLKPTVSEIKVETALQEILRTFNAPAAVWNGSFCRTDTVKEKVVQYKLPVTFFPRGRSLHGMFKAVTDLYEGRAQFVKVDRGHATRSATPYHYVTVTIGWI